MLLELIGATCFTLFATAFSGQKNADGLELPADPAQQVKVLVSHCLTQLKPLLIDARLSEVEPGRVTLASGELIRAEAGEVHRRNAGGEECLLGRLGPEGGAEFRLTSPTSLEITLWAVAGPEARHHVTVRLPVQSG